MRRVPLYNYFKTKRDKEFLLDVVGLNYIKPYVSTNSGHTLAYYDITFINEGKGFFTVNEQTHLVGNGDVMFTKPGELRNWDNKSIKDGIAFIFDGNFISSLFNDADLLQNLSFFAAGRYSAKLSMPAEAGFKINTLLYDIRAVVQNTAKDWYQLRNLVYELFTYLSRVYINEHNVLPMLPEAKKNVKNRHVNEFLDLVNMEYSQQHAIRYYAAKLDITPNYLNEMVKKSIGINAKQYIQNRLTLEAKRMLTHTDHPVSAIADALYFENPSYFIRFFRIQTTYTPLQYRNMVKACG